MRNDRRHEQFLAPYKIPLPAVPEYEAAQASAAPANFKFTALNDVVDKEAGTRKLTLKIDHPEVIWTGTVSHDFQKKKTNTDVFLLPSYRF